MSTKQKENYPEDNNSSIDFKRDEESTKSSITKIYYNMTGEEITHDVLDDIYQTAVMKFLSGKKFNQERNIPIIDEQNYFRMSYTTAISDYLSLESTLYGKNLVEPKKISKLVKRQTESTLEENTKADKIFNETFQPVIDLFVEGDTEKITDVDLLKLRRLTILYLGLLEMKDNEIALIVFSPESQFDRVNNVDYKFEEGDVDSKYKYKFANEKDLKKASQAIRKQYSKAIKTVPKAIAEKLGVDETKINPEILRRRDKVDKIRVRREQRRKKDESEAI